MTDPYYLSELNKLFEVLFFLNNKYTWETYSSSFDYPINLMAHWSNNEKQNQILKTIVEVFSNQFPYFIPHIHVS